LRSVIARHKRWQLDIEAAYLGAVARGLGVHQSTSFFLSKVFLRNKRLENRFSKH
jgi:hypothetical protein